MLHLQDVLRLDDCGVAGGGNKDVDLVDDTFEACYLEAIHGCLKCADWVYFANDDSSALTCHGLGCALAYIAVTGHKHGLATD